MNLRISKNLKIGLISLLLVCAESCKTRVFNSKSDSIAQVKNDRVNEEYQKFLNIVDPKTLQPVKSVEEFLERIPSDWKWSPSYIYESRSSLQEATEDSPRIIFSSRDSKIVLAVTGNAAAKGGNSIEVMAFDDANKKFQFTQVDPALEGKGFTINEKPETCARCHNGMPLMDEYKFWPGWVGSNLANSREVNIFRNLLAKEESSEYRFRFFHNSVTPKTLNDGSDIQLHNVRLNAQLNNLNQRMIYKTLQSQPSFRSWSAEIWAGLHLNTQQFEQAMGLLNHKQIDFATEILRINANASSLYQAYSEGIYKRGILLRGTSSKEAIPEISKFQPTRQLLQFFLVLYMASLPDFGSNVMSLEKPTYAFSRQVNDAYNFSQTPVAKEMSKALADFHSQYISKEFPNCGITLGEFANTSSTPQLDEKVLAALAQLKKQSLEK